MGNCYYFMMTKNMMKGSNPKYTYKPGSYTDKKFQLSRSGIDEYLDCKKCFYLNRRLGLKKPSQIPFNLNSAVDNLFKNEFDNHRRMKSKHPIMEKYGIDAIPYSHPELDIWRHNFSGVRVDLTIKTETEKRSSNLQTSFDDLMDNDLEKSTKNIDTDIEIFGAVDDIWTYPNGDLVVVDYKSTSKSVDNQFHSINTWDDVWSGGKMYKRQLEIYQWLLSEKGFSVSSDCYIVYANAHKDKQEFNSVLDFEVTLLRHEGDISWIDSVLKDVYKLLNSDDIPDSDSECELCGYVIDANRLIS